jgi:hypothetical protein
MAVDYTYWDSHKLDYGSVPYVINGAPPNGVVHLYLDTPNIILPTMESFCTDAGLTCSIAWPIAVASNQGGSSETIYDWAQPLLEYNIDAMAIYPSAHYMKGVGGGNTNHYDTFGDGMAFQGYIGTNLGWTIYGPLYVYHAGAYTPIPANVTFSISDSANFTAKLSGVAILLSNGQSNTTGADGTAFISITPNSSAYTYDLTKSSYTDVNARSLGGYGITGGIVYDTMTYAVITTLTPVPTYPPTPAGYIRTIVRAQDGNIGSLIPGATLNLRDVQNTSWKNSTTTDGISYIDTLPTHLIDVYGSASGYSSSQETNAAIGGTYRLPLYRIPLSPGTGNINLMVAAYNQDGLSLPGVRVSTILPSGATTIQATNSGGTTTFVVPNKTLILIYAEKTGYKPSQSSLTTGDFTDMQTRITLIPDYVPTVTATPIGYTTVPTYAPNCNPDSLDYDYSLCSTSKNQDVMKLVQDNAPMIVELGIYALILGLLGLILSSISNWGR